MPSKKISQLTAATAPLSTDLHALARSTSNRKLTTAGLFNETITLANFTTLQTASGLIPGRWYRVTGCAVSGTAIYQVLAVKANAYSPYVFVEDISGVGTIGSWAYIYALSNDDQLRLDAYGNEFYNLLSEYGGVQVNQGTLLGCRLNATAALFNSTDGNALNCTFDEGEYNLAGANLVQSYFGGINNLMNPDEYTYIIFHSTVNNTSFNINGNSVNLFNTFLSNVNLNMGADCRLNNCRFENVNVEIVNAADVRNLTIIGTQYSDNLPYYKIDGSYQGQVLNNWAGTVIADTQRGSSTVQARVEVNDSGDPLTFDSVAKTLNLPNHSTVIGTYLLPETNGNESLQYITNAPANYLHSIRIKKIEYLVGFQYTTTKVDYSSMTSGDEIIVYHGHTSKVGQLATTSCFLELRSLLAHPIGQNMWTIEYGAHYD